MKNVLGTVVLTTVAAGSTNFANAAVLAVSDVSSVGIDHDEIIRRFSSEFNVTLNLADLLEVQSINEGNALRVETMDHLAIVVPVFNARGPYNKDGQ